MGIRRMARELALQQLFAWDLCQDKSSSNQIQDSEVWSFVRLEEEKSLPQEALAFGRKLVTGVRKHQKDIDAMIEKHSTHWKLSRMPVVDRNIIRMAVYELNYCEDIPSSVTLNEAIEIAKRFGSEESSTFVNGVLDRIAKEKISSQKAEN